jgi:hypothetical protein
MLELIVVFAFTAVGFTFVARAVAEAFEPSLLLYKPLACSLCMAWWPCLFFGASTAFAAGFNVTDGAALVFGATGFGFLLNKVIDRLRYEMD